MSDTPETVTPIITYQEWYDNNIARVKDKADEAYRASVNNAQLTYEQALGAYGTNAERLASMGLSNSGYSDYLKTRAYDTYRSEVSAAEKLRSDTIADAELTYGEKLLDKQETQKTNDLPSFVTNAGNGLYASDQIETIISENGYTGADADAIRVAFKEYQNGRNLKISEISNNIALGNFATWNDLSNYATAAGFGTEPELNAFKDQYIEYLSKPNEMMSDVDRLNELQKIDPDGAYAKVKTSYISAANVGKGIYVNSDGTFVNVETARSQLNEIINNPHYDEPTKAKATQVFNDIYAVNVADTATFGGVDPSSKYEDNFWIKIPGYFDSSDTEGAQDNGKIKVALAKSPTSPDELPEITDSLNNQAVFAYNGKIYVKYNDEIYEVKLRNSNQKNDYNALLKYFEQNKNYRSE